jgi:formylmethanofuran dehydrogenase subunit E
VQYLSGCTFGKGNLIFRDFGKQVYTFFHRASGRAVRVTTADSEGMQARPGAERGAREQWIAWLVQAPEAEVVRVEEVNMAPPEFARIRRSVDCAFCGERVMETRARVWEGRFCCIPCALQRDAAAAVTR